MGSFGLLGIVQMTFLSYLNGIMKNVEKEKGSIMKRVIEIRAAEGGEDSKLFASDLANAYIKMCQRLG